MNTFKRNKVIMLPTEKADYTSLIKNDDLPNRKGLFWSQNRSKDSYFTQAYLKSADAKSYHLYIISDKITKENEWFIGLDNESIYRCTKDTEGTHKKIIATTDTSIAMLIPDSIISKAPTYFPQPSQSFIQIFIEEYNKGNVITDVMVEYIIGQGYENGEIQSIKEHLYIKSDNTITIRKIKDSWNREEIIKLYEIYQLECLNGDGDYSMSYDEWIKNNL